MAFVWRFRRLHETPAPEVPLNIIYSGTLDKSRVVGSLMFAYEYDKEMTSSFAIIIATSPRKS
jgi:hypothetical protein